MSGDDIAALCVAGPIGLGVVALIVHVFVEGARHRLWPRGLRWFPGAWLGTAHALHWGMLRVFWPENLPRYRSLKTLELESLDTQWRLWQGISDRGVPQWKPGTGRDGRWEPRPVPEETCSCGRGHENGSCPEDRPAGPGVLYDR